MSGPTQAHIVEVEYLLRSLGTKLATHNAEDIATPGLRSFGDRSVAAACLTLFVFVPGCAATVVFLTRADGNVLPIVAPDSNPPFVAKSDRLPLAQWSIETTDNLGAEGASPFAATTAIEDSTFPAPILIRGSLDGTTTTTFVEPAATLGNDASASKRRPKREIRRAKPPKIIAEFSPPAATASPL